MGFAQELHDDAEEKGMTEKDYKAIAREVLLNAGCSIDPDDESIEFVVDPEESPVETV